MATGAALLRLERPGADALRGVAEGEEPVLGREQGGRRAGRDADLRVDVLDVVADRLRRDLELPGDLLVEQAAREQPQDLDLARREAGRALRPPRDLVAGRDEYGVDRL